MKVARSIKRLPEWLRSFVGANALRVMALGALVAVAVPASGARAEPQSRPSFLDRLLGRGT